MVSWHKEIREILPKLRPGIDKERHTDIHTLDLLDGKLKLLLLQEKVKQKKHKTLTKPTSYP